MGVRNGSPIETGFTPPTASATRRRAINVWVIALVLIVFYSGLSFYMGTFQPFRIVSGDSMAPVLGSGDIVLIKSVSFAEVRIGDIVAYTSPNPEVSHPEGKPHTILHRVYGFDVSTGRRVISTEDSNGVPDSWDVTSGLLQGKMAFRVPLSAWSLSFLTGLGGLALASVSAIILTISIYVGSLSKSSLSSKILQRFRGAKGRRQVASMASSLRMSRFVPGTDNAGRAIFDRIRNSASARSKREIVDTALDDSLSVSFETPAPSEPVESLAEPIPLGPATTSAQNALDQAPDLPTTTGSYSMTSNESQNEAPATSRKPDWYLDVNQTWANTFLLISSPAPVEVIYPYLGANRWWSVSRLRVNEAWKRTASESEPLSAEDDSILKLAQAVIGYTRNYEEHKAAVEGLAEVAKMLEDAVNRQSESLEIPTLIKLPTEQAPDEDRAGVLV